MEYYEHKLDPVGVRPDWFDAPADASWQYLRGSIWFTAHQSPKEDFRFIGAIRIPASHWAVPALKAGKVPVRGDTDLNQRA